MNVLGCIPSLREIIFYITGDAGTIQPFLQASPFQRLMHSIFPHVTKTRPYIDFSVAIRSDPHIREQIYMRDLQQGLVYFRHLPKPFRITLLCSSILQEDYGESLEDPTAFLETLGNTAELYQVQEPVNLPSCENLRNLRSPSKGRHLDLSGVDLSLSAALAYIHRNGDNLRTLYLSLVAATPLEPLINSNLPNLTSLDVSCPAEWAPYNQSTELQGAVLRKMEMLLQNVSMPNLRSCALDLPAWTVSTNCVVLGFLASLPKIGKVQLHYFSEGDAQDGERLKQTQALISSLKEKGIRVTLDVRAWSIQPGEAMLRSQFDKWLPWYPSQYYGSRSHL